MRRRSVVAGGTRHHPGRLLAHSLVGAMFALMTLGSSSAQATCSLPPTCQHYTTTTASADNPGATTGTAVSFTATVTYDGGPSHPPGGSVTFVFDGTDPVTVDLDPTTGSANSGPRTFTTSGRHTYSASFNGYSFSTFADFSSSSSGLYEQHFADATATTLTAAAGQQNPGPPGSYSYTITVADSYNVAQTPTDSVVVTLDGADQPPLSLTAGQANFTTTLGVGGHTISARYGGVADSWAPSASSVFTQTVSNPPPAPPGGANSSGASTTTVSNPSTGAGTGASPGKTTALGKHSSRKTKKAKRKGHAKKRKGHRHHKRAKH